MPRVPRFSRLPRSSRTVPRSSGRDLAAVATNWVLAGCSVVAVGFTWNSMYGAAAVEANKRKGRLLEIEELRNKREMEFLEKVKSFIGDVASYKKAGDGGKSKP